MPIHLVGVGLIADMGPDTTSTSEPLLEEDLVVGREGQTLLRRRCALIANRRESRGSGNSIMLRSPIDAEAQETSSGCRRCCGLAPLALATLALASGDRI
eukprot:6038345-Heterocapsa_arctica.AAC.1